MNTGGDWPRTAHSVHIACYLLMTAVFSYVAVERYRRPLVIQDDATTEPAGITRIETRIDPNIASWAELAHLPDVGESLARAIVAYREERLARTGTPAAKPAAVFRSLADLDAIPGLGKKTLRRIEPYLRFPK